MVGTNGFSIYFAMQDVSFGNIVKYFVGGGVELPPRLQNLISVGSATVSFNPTASTAAAVVSSPPAPGDVVASSSAGCNNAFNLLSFAPLPSGVS